MTIAEAINATSRELSGISDNPRLDTERLVLHITGADDTSWLYAHGEQLLVSEQLKKLNHMSARRAQGEPLAYILGTWDFYGRTFEVTPDVLVPRPETEQLVQTALLFLHTLKYRQADRPITIADVGTGSGCIAITLALELAGSTSPIANYTIIATDISHAALAVAQRNAQRHNVSDAIEFRQGDMLTPLHNESVDCIVSNPPYVPAEELRQPAEAKAGYAGDTIGLTFEPKAALDGGPDGTAFTRTLKASGIPAIVETTGGVVEMFNADEKLLVPSQARGA